MRNLLLSLAILTFLAGCAVSRFDNNELNMATEIRYMVQQDSICSNAADAAILAKKLAEKSSFFAMYVEHTPNNVETISMVTELNKETQAFDKSYQTGNPSTAYCKNKLEVIQHSADSVQKSMAIKPRK